MLRAGRAAELSGSGSMREQSSETPEDDCCTTWWPDADDMYVVYVQWYGHECIALLQSKPSTR